MSTSFTHNALFLSIVPSIVLNGERMPYNKEPQKLMEQLFTRDAGYFDILFVACIRDMEIIAPDDTFRITVAAPGIILALRISFGCFQEPTSVSWYVYSRIHSRRSDSYRIRIIFVGCDGTRLWSVPETSEAK